MSTAFLHTPAAWRAPPGVVQIAHHEVHVWRAPLDLPAAEVQVLQRWLSSDESQRAQRFMFARDRTSFVVARGLLRAIVSRYIGIAPDQVQFGYTTYGKPLLLSQHGIDMRFNLSHSGGLVLYALSCGREVGIDIEQLRGDVTYHQIAQSFFSAREQAELQRITPAQQCEAFFTCWTRKEAFVKAHGSGLSLPLNQFDVSLAPDQPARLIGTQWNPAEAERWALHSLAPGAGYVGALAVQGHDWQLVCWQEDMLATMLQPRWQHAPPAEALPSAAASRR